MSIMPDQLGEPLDARPLLRTVRARLDDLVASLTDADWRRPTACPGWSVADLVAHLVGDDLGRLSRTHDQAIGVQPAPGEDLPMFLDRINEEWVVAFRRLSPAVVGSLLGAGGVEVVALWDGIGLDATTDGVSWAGLVSGPAWMDLGRDVTEYWIHEQQLREAVGRPHRDDREVRFVVDVLARGLPFALRAVEAAERAAVAIRADDLGATWTVVRRDGRWWFHGRSMADPPPAGTLVAVVSAPGDALWRRWSRHPANDRADFACTGDPEAGAAVVDHLAIIRGPEGPGS